MNRRFKRPGTHVDHSQRPNLIKHQPNARIWRADITYLELRPGTWVYLSSIYEPKVHQVLAFKIGRQMEATLVVETINQALECHQKPQYFHSDMGSQYTSNEVETLLERHQISHSYSKQGYPYDNGPIEAFHSLLKREFAFQTTFSDFEDLVIRTSNYISWFNSDRIRTSVQKKMCHLLTQEHHELLVSLLLADDTFTTSDELDAGFIADVEFSSALDATISVEALFATSLIFVLLSNDPELDTVFTSDVVATQAS